MSPQTNHLRRFHREDDGFTLVELMTAIVIGVVIIAAAFGAASAAARLQNKTSNRIDAINRGRNAMEAMTQAIRSQQCAFGTRPMLWASDTGMEFYGSAAAFNQTTPAGTSATNPGAVQPIQRIRIEWIQNNAAQATAAQIQNNANPTGDIVMTVETQTNPGYTPMNFKTTMVRQLADDVEKAPDRNTTVYNTTPLSSVKFVPFFQYYEYQDAVGDGRIDLNSPVAMVASAKDPLLNPNGVASAPAADLSGIVLVQVNFRSTPRQAASDGYSGRTAASAGVNFYNTVSVRIADPSNPGGSPQCL
ncbi:MAG: prepilin-type N-terminal cleavage/methylation domain-containing protein [Solirubrobacteraceae bacterium]|nr:prepilin-type N-terminal cleavage/methylation domain-containing protein [Patulibacter sp.]